MEKTETEERPKVPMKVKGSLIGVQVDEGSKICQLWFSSTTGGQTDSQIFEMQCSSHGQARVVAEIHRSVWGL